MPARRLELELERPRLPPTTAANRGTPTIAADGVGIAFAVVPAPVSYVCVCYVIQY